MIESEEERATCAAQGLTGTFWTELLLPEIQKVCKIKGRQLFTAAAADDDLKRGWIQALEWVMNYPQTIIDSVALDEAKARDADEDTREDDFRADQGFRSPIRQAPEPGELKMEEK